MTFVLKPRFFRALSASDCFCPDRSGIGTGGGPLLIWSVSSSVTRTFCPAAGSVPTALPLAILEL